MPHQVHQRKFGRKSDLRRSLLRNLTMSVLRYERVKTTEAKAKEVRGLVDRMINLGKDGSIEARRRATGWIPEPVIVEKLFADLAHRYPDRSSGFLRITRLARRVGDNSPLMLVELMPGVDETKAAAAADAKPRRRRLPFRRGAAERADDDKTTGGPRPPRTPRADAKTPGAAVKTKTGVKKATTRTKKTAKSSPKED